MTDQTTTRAEPQVEGYIIRPVTMEDASLFRGLIEHFFIENFGSSNFTVEDVKAEWSAPRFNIEESIRIVLTPEGEPVGFIEVNDSAIVPVRPQIAGFIRKDHRGRGISTALMHWAIARAHDAIARVPENARVVIECYHERKTQDVKPLLEAFGFKHYRSSYTMQIEMTEAPVVTPLPDHLRIVTYAELPDLRQFVHAHMESFRDHRGFVDSPIEKRLEMWQHMMDSTPDFDPDLWMLVMEGDKPAAIIVGAPHDESDAELGWINIVGVLSEYRRQGLGLAMLQYAFNEYWKRGIKKVGLGVDGASLTNATRLYEKAGMYIRLVWESHELEIRPGEEISRQS